LNLKDTLQCVELAMLHPAERGQLRILNQFTELFSVNELAEKVQKVGDRLGFKVQVKHIDNPRKEKEDHYYNPTHHGLLELGLKPHPMTEEVVFQMLQQVRRYKERIDTQKIMPRVKTS
jgi:UDP-sulfoquinovose synthase